MVRRDPRLFGIEGTRWTLEAIHRVCDWLRLASNGGLHRLLDRLGITWKRSRDYVHSPDPDYEAKLALVGKLVEEGRRGAGVVVLYLDEITYTRQPTLANAYEERGPRQALARRSYRRNSLLRVVASLDSSDGRVVYRQAHRITVPVLVAFYQQLRGAYPEARRIYVVQDNWPDHFHPDLLAALEEQESPWPFLRPPNWPREPSRRASEQWAGLGLPIQLVTLPTYASWTNPIEKLWRWLRQEVLHLHRMADHLDQLKAHVDDFLTRFASGSLDLLRYVGLAASG